MTAATHALRSVPLRREPLLPNGVLGMLVFVLTEIMFFAGMVSALLIARTGSRIPWPPPGQPRLPIEATAFNTVALLASGFVLFLAGRALAENPARARRLLLGALGLGTFFVLFQGAEWASLIGEGLTLTSSTHGSFFYVIVGTHAAHAVAAIAALWWVYRRLATGTLDPSTLWATQVFWYFVVGVWPVLYYTVYL